MDELTIVNDKTSLEAVLEGKKAFRCQSKSWFLTYPKCPLTKEEGMQLLKAKLAARPIRGIVVAAELHKDGTNHLHAYILLEKMFDCKDARFWDLDMFHGNYQKARDINAVVQYIKKDGNILEEGEISWAEKLDAKKDHRRALAKKLLDGSCTLESAVDEDPSLLYGLRHLKQDLDTYLQLKVKPLEADDVRGIWIYGPPGIGKSRLVRRVETADPSLLYTKAQNKWWDGYHGQKAVLLDDFDRKGECLSHHLKIWADRYGAFGEIKGGQVPLAYERFYITSNYSPSQVFSEDPDLLAAIERRFKVVHMLDKDLCLDGYEPEEPVLGKRRTIFEN